MDRLTGFVAYPSTPPSVGSAIQSALNELKPYESEIHLDSWVENDIAGRFLVEPILKNIQGSDVLVADITFLNFNVAFEIGYAVGKKKRILLIRNSSLKGSDSLIREVGIFDSLGYYSYENSKDLSAFIRSVKDKEPISFDSTQVNRGTPVYLVLPRNRTDAEFRVVSRIKKARLFYRSFDGAEEPRLSAIDAISNVAESFGVVLVMMPKERMEFEVHNLRSAFVAGLSMAMEKELLILQQGEDPVPLDYRDLVPLFMALIKLTNILRPFLLQSRHIFREFSQFCQRTL